MLKRSFDFSVAVLAALAFTPVMLVVALIVRLGLGGPILFTQARPGLGGKAIHVYKFRTMTSERDSAGKLLPDDRRLTRLGLFLRKTSLDELPQLFNVIRGDLSLVGPRPLLMEYLPLYSPRQARRHDVRPGITGWAQVNGRNAISWEQKFEYDVWYVENRSFFLDLRILALTVKKVLGRSDISAQGTNTMPKFEGSSPLNRG
ncbi:sugar transferase [Massilia varians]